MKNRSIIFTLGGPLLFALVLGLVAVTMKKRRSSGSETANVNSPDHGPGDEGEGDANTPSSSSWRSIGSVGSARSIGSVGSFCSIGSIGSSFSIGSIGSSCSIASIGSFASIGSIASVGSIGSFAGRFSRFSVLAKRGTL
jgi:hypothetical protein